MKVKNFQNHGMSSIVFAIAFVTILSLLAVGFATIARRDTNEVLDRTLSYQAQYAAESGINKAIKQIKAGTTSQTDCTNPSASFTLSPGVDITCVTWRPAPGNEVVFSNIKENPKKAKLESTGDDISKINIEWSYADPVSNITGGIKPSIDGKNILKIALANPDAPSPTNNLMYANATNSPGTTTTNLQDGASFDVNCTGNSCSLDINSLGGNTWFLALSSLGKDVSRATITAYNGTGQLNLADVQIEIDSNAIANGVTKRLLARVPIESSSWIPANAVTANRICKDIRIDGTNNESVSGNTDSTNALSGCPNGINPPSSSGSAEVYPPPLPPSGGNDDADISTPPPQTAGNAPNTPEWHVWYSVRSSTIPNDQRASCTFQLLYSKDNINPALMQPASSVRTYTGQQCNDFRWGDPKSGVLVTFKPGITGNGTQAWQQCSVDLLPTHPCNTSGYYNAVMYITGYNGVTVGPRYRMNTTNTSFRNSCRPLITTGFTATGAHIQQCKLTP